MDLLWDRLSKDPRVASVTYVTKAEALARAQQIPGLPQLAAATDSNPFPASLDVRVKNIDDVAAIDTLVRTDIAVDPVYPTSYDRGAYQRIQAVLFGAAVAGFAFLSLLGFVAVTVTMNSIRAAIHSRRDEVTIMQLVGAPRWMVRGPFVVEGAITGALSGAVAGLITFGLAMAAMGSGPRVVHAVRARHHCHRRGDRGDDRVRDRPGPWAQGHHWSACGGTSSREISRLALRPHAPRRAGCGSARAWRGAFG